MVLLHALALQAKANRWKLTVAHLNHRLRGRASDADEAFVRRAALRYGFPFASQASDVGEAAARNGISIEMAGRQLRHEFLARTARARGIRTIALAHHADDQVETFFLRLLRGAGGEGLAGMKWRSPSPVDRKIALARPLLAFSKAEIRGFARQHKIRFREDATNASLDILRNRLRHELLPLLRERYQAALDRTVLRLMELVGAEAEFAFDAAQRFLANANGESKREQDFDGLSVAVQRRVIQQQFVALGLLVDFQAVEQLRQHPLERIQLEAGKSIWRDRNGAIHIESSGVRALPEFRAESLTVELSSRRGRVDFAERRIEWAIAARRRSLRSRPGKPPGAGVEEFFDADAVGAAIVLRHWQAGDRFQPIGMNAAVKLQDLFVNAKIPANRRRGLMLAATSAGEIFWVEGLRIGERFKLTAKTRRALSWRVS